MNEEGRANPARAAFLDLQVAELANRSPADEIHDREQDDGAEKRPQERFHGQPAVDIALSEQQSGNHCANDSNDNIENDALLGVGAHDQTCKPADNAADDEPYDDTHQFPSCCWPPRYAAAVRIKTRDASWLFRIQKSLSSNKVRIRAAKLAAKLDRLAHVTSCAGA